MTLFLNRLIPALSCICGLKAALKTRAVQTLCDHQQPACGAKRLDCVRFIAAPGRGFRNRLPRKNSVELHQEQAASANRNSYKYNDAFKSRTSTLMNG